MRLWLALAGINGFIGVALGAFAAHVLRERLAARSFEIWEVAVRYQMYHALALLGVAILSRLTSSGLTDAAGWSFTAGIILFSGSLYALALSDIKILGAITPFGGLGFLAGWVLLALSAWLKR